MNLLRKLTEAYKTDRAQTVAVACGVLGGLLHALTWYAQQAMIGWLGSWAFLAFVPSVGCLAYYTRYLIRRADW